MYFIKDSFIARQLIKCFPIFFYQRRKNYPALNGGKDCTGETVQKCMTNEMMEKVLGVPNLLGELFVLLKKKND